MYARSAIQTAGPLQFENFPCKEVTLNTVLPILVIFALGTSLLGWQTQNTQISLIQEHAVCVAAAPLAGVSLKDIFFAKSLTLANTRSAKDNGEASPLPIHDPSPTIHEPSLIKEAGLVTDASTLPIREIQKESIEILPLVINVPCPGRCEQVFVKPGDRVIRGSALCEMESMKMFHTIRSSKEGKVKEVFVHPLKEVSAQDTLFSIEVS